MKRFITGNYVLQLLLSGIEDMEIIYTNKKEWNGKNYLEVTFEFADEKGKEVHEIIKNFRKEKNLAIENFDKLKVKRKELLDRYFKGKKCEDNGV